MIPLYLQRAQYFAEKYFLFNIFEGARVLGIKKNNKPVPVQMKTYGPVHYRSQFSKSISYSRMWKLTVLERKANQFPLKTYKKEIGENLSLSVSPLLDNSQLAALPNRCLTEKKSKWNLINTDS